MRYTARKIKNIYSLKPTTRTTPILANLVAILNLTKLRIEETVSSLTKEQLDFIIDEETPTIGTLIKHMAFGEYALQKQMFLKRHLNSKEMAFWKGSITGEFLSRSVKGRKISEYFELWDDIRTETIERLLKHDDDWLFKEILGHTNYFLWFHLIEDHLGHLGQIKSIIRKAGLRLKIEGGR